MIGPEILEFKAKNRALEINLDPKSENKNRENNTFLDYIRVYSHKIHKLCKFCAIAFKTLRQTYASQFWGK
jgi:hypothetical protein